MESTTPPSPAPERKYFLWHGKGAFRAEKGGTPSWHKTKWGESWIRITGREPRETTIVAFKFHDESVWDVEYGWN